MAHLTTSKKAASADDSAKVSQSLYFVSKMSKQSVGEINCGRGVEGWPQGRGGGIEVGACGVPCFLLCTTRLDLGSMCDMLRRDFCLVGIRRFMPVPSTL